MHLHSIQDTAFTAINQVQKTRVSTEFLQQYENESNRDRNRKIVVCFKLFFKKFNQTAGNRRKQYSPDRNALYANYRFDNKYADCGGENKSENSFKRFAVDRLVSAETPSDKGGGGIAQKLMQKGGAKE